jgi:hypothetical protein
MGVGAANGVCRDPDSCECLAQAGDARCVPGGAGGEYGAYQCVYASCNGANEDQACALPDGGAGICCQGACSSSVPNPIVMIPISQANCGACGYACPSASTCNVGGVCSPGCPTQPCPAELVCLPGSTLEGSACVHGSCTAQPDGTRCSSPASVPNAPIKGVPSGICCGGQCVDPSQDGTNCGGCGIVCCPGTACISSSPLSVEAQCMPN